MKGTMFEVLLLMLYVLKLGVSGKSVARPMESGFPITGCIELSISGTVVPFALTLLRLFISTVPSTPKPFSIETEMLALLNCSALGALLLNRLATENVEVPV